MMNKQARMLVAITGTLAVGAIGGLGAAEICDVFAFEYYSTNIPDTTWGKASDSGANLHVEYRINNGYLEILAQEITDGKYYNPASPTPATLEVRWPGGNLASHDFIDGRAEVSLDALKLYNKETCFLDFEIDFLDMDENVIYPVRVHYGPILSP